jgi:hypothetical protein
MALWYVDHDNTTLYTSAYMATPSGPSQLPQEGDGKASGTGATPAVASASMDFTGVTAAAGATFGVHGATLTCVASGASTVQFNAGSGSTLATNLATAINAATAAVTTATGNITSPYLKGLCWASASGAVLTVYTRIASADLNQSANASAILTCGSLANWTSAPANANFTGGVSGPWRYIFNTSALALVNATVGDAVMEYGALLATMMGTPAAGDKIKARSKRSGSNIAVTFGTATWTATIRPGGTALNRVAFEVDDGTVWSGDSGVLTWTFTTNSITEVINLPTTTFWHWKGVDLGSDTRNFKWVCQARGANFYYPQISVLNLPHILENIEVDTPDNNSTGRLMFYDLLATTANAGNKTKLKGLVLRSRSSVGGWFVGSPSFGRHAYDLEDCKLIYTNQAGSNTRFFWHPYDPASRGASHYSTRVKLLRCIFSGLASPTGSGNTPWPVGSGVTITGAAAGGLTWEAEDCDLTNASLEGLVQTSAFEKYTPTNVVSLINSTAKREYAMDRADGYREWFPGRGFPTLAESVLPDGTTWSIRCCPLPAATDFNSANPFEAPPLSKLNTLADGARTATIHFCVDDDIKTAAGGTLTSADFGVRATWTDTSGVQRSADTLTPNSVDATALAAGSTAWSTGNPPTYGSAGNFTSYKIEVPMASVKNLTNVTLQLVCTRAGATRAQFWFVSPEWSLA